MAIIRLFHTGLSISITNEVKQAFRNNDSL
nr:MAG TPA: hypothetical protein [Caudoviricetes sp.]